jgi:hypothetical protein
VQDRAASSNNPLATHGCWADPGRTKRGEINLHDGGRGDYFEDPNGHLLEVITRPYGSRGWEP